MHDQVLDVVKLDLVAGILAVENLVAGLDIHGQYLAFLGHFALAGGYNLAFLRLFLGGLGNNDSASLAFLLLNRLDENPVAQGLKLDF